MGIGDRKGLELNKTYINFIVQHNSSQQAKDSSYQETFYSMKDVDPLLSELALLRKAKKIQDDPESETYLQVKLSELKSLVEDFRPLFDSQIEFGASEMDQAKALIERRNDTVMGIHRTLERLIRSSQEYAGYF